MKNRKIHILVSALVLLTIATLFTATWADVGNFNSYDSSSSGGGYSSNDWDSSDNYGYIGGIGSDDGDDGGGGWGGAIIVAIIVIAIVVIRGNRKGNSAPVITQQQQAQDHTEQILAAITAIDGAFSKDKFIGWAKEVFLTLQTAWMERDWSKIRPFEKEELYRQHEMQLKEYIKTGKINVLERINVNQSYLQKYERDKEYEYLTVYMDVRMVDYIKDEKTGNILKGDPNTDCYLQYLLTFIRKTGVLTAEATTNTSTVECPNCGAPTQITSAGKCEYCDSIIKTGEYDWVLANLDGIRPGMQIDNRGVIIRDNDMQ